MVDGFKQLVSDQFQATLCMLNACVERCPQSAWNAPVRSHAFCQSAFHALFFTDFYLGADPESFRQQPFHREHEGSFGDYEELEDRRPQTLYDKAWIKTYVQHCRNKALQVIAAETGETLSARAGFEWLKFSRAELYVYTIRHIQHHAAQLSLRLGIDFDDNVPWFKSGWRDP